jgi:WD40 repeat protein
LPEISIQVSFVQTLSRITRDNSADLVELAVLRLSNTPLHLTLSPTGDRLASSNKQHLVLYRTGGDPEVPLIETGRMDVSHAWISRFQPGGEMLASTGGIFDGTVRLWNLATQQAAGVLGKRMRPVLGLDFHPDGDVLAGAGWGGHIWLWNAHDGRTIQTAESHETLIRTLTFSPDGQFIASGGGIFDGNIRIWYIEDKQRLHLFDAYTHLSGKLLYSPNGAYFASAGRDRIIHLWNATDGQEHVSLYGHADEVRDIAFSPDSLLLASAGGEGIVRLWDVETGRPLLALSGHRRRVRSVIFSPDGRLLYSAGDDKTIRVYSVGY